MGCGASADEDASFTGNTRFTNPQLFNLDGLVFDNPPEGVFTTQGFHPGSRRIDAKHALHNVIRTNEAGVLMFAASSCAVDCLFLYPEYAATNGQQPTSDFGMPMTRAQNRVQKDQEERKKKGEDVSAGAGLLSSVSSTFGSVMSKAAPTLSSLTGGATDDLLMEDADDEFNDTPPASKGGARKPATPGGPDAGKPKWQAAVCQFKEFDSLDDIPKPWFRDAGGGVPGVLRLESAGPAAAWVTLQPHVFQQRWALPNGDRVATFTDDSPSIPQRILAAYRACGGPEYLQLLLERIQAVRRAIPDDILLAAFDVADMAAVTVKQTKLGDAKADAAADAAADEAVAAARKALLLAERAKELDIEGLIKSFQELMSDEQMGSFGSVYQLPEALDDIKSILGYIEDALLYNWLEIAVEANLEVGTHYFMQNDKSAARETEFKLFDAILRKFLTEANELTDELLVEFKDHLALVTQTVLQNAFDADAEDSSLVKSASDAAKKQIDALFPDLPDMVKMDADSLDAELAGIIPTFVDTKPFDAMLYSAEEVPELLRKWRQEDSEPEEERRKRVYEKQVARFADMCARGASKMAAMHRIGERSRIPALVPRHFHEFEVVLLFPRLVDHPETRRPSTARLCIWPEGCLAAEQRVELRDFTLPNGGVSEENALIEKAATLYDEGDDEIDTSDDPRKSWSEYPSSDWRGFECTVEVALDMVYNYNFELDGVVFLDHNSFVVDKEKEYFRRVCFQQHARKFTFNPLKELGLVA